MEQDQIMTASTDDMKIVAGGMAVAWGGGKVACALTPGADYAHYKRKLIKMRYSNDDQIAIMLNDDADEMARMQAWRDWAAAVARKIIEMTGE